MVKIASLGGKGIRTTLVFAFALCYTRFGTKMSKPYAQEMWKIGEPRW